MARTVLVCEDDAAIREGLSDLLADEGYAVTAVGDGEAALERARRDDPDVIVLDVMLPGLTGFEVCGRLHRERIRGAVLLLTARTTERDKVEGFEAGADDYLTKPFSTSELLLRVRALLRRVPERSEAPMRLRLGDAEVDFERFEVRRGRSCERLSSREARILQVLCERPGRVVSRNELLDRVWGYDVYPTTRTVDMHMVRLRKLIEPEPGQPRFIVSVRGVGYKLVVA